MKARLMEAHHNKNYWVCLTPGPRGQREIRNKSASGGNIVFFRCIIECCVIIILLHMHRIFIT